LETAKCLALSHCVGVTLLLAGLTVLARIVRLTRSLFWWGFGLVFFIACLMSYRLLICEQSPLCCSACNWPNQLGQCWAWGKPPLFSLGLVSLAIWVGLFAVFFSVLAGGLRRPNWGMRTLLIPAATGLALYLVDKVELTSLSFLQAWSLLLASAFFFYLWWLVALLFDLVFVWHRYIRHSKKWKL